MKYTYIHEIHESPIGILVMSHHLTLEIQKAAGEPARNAVLKKVRDIASLSGKQRMLSGKQMRDIAPFCCGDFER